MFTNFRRADGSVGRLALLVRLCVALAVALLSVPLLNGSTAYADGETTPADGSTVASEPAAPEAEPEPDPAPAEPAPAEPLTEEPAVVDETATATEEVRQSGPKAAAPQLKTAPSSGIQAAAAPGGNCSASFSQNTQENRGGQWINGALQQNNSNYAEGDYVPQRVELTGLTAGTHTLTFSYDRTKSGKYAYDFVDHLSISGSTGAIISWDAAAPNPPMPFAEEVVVTITFTITDPNDSTATIFWDGHIASELDYGPDSAAGSVSGAPYHFALEGLSCGSVGQQDNQLMADAVDSASLTIVKDAQPNDADDFHFTLSAPNNLNTTFDLDDDADATLPNSTNYNVPPGVTSINEINIPGGWTLTDITCIRAGVEIGVQSGDGISLTLADNNNVTCTFTNTRESSLEVDKMWVINGGSPVQEGSEPAHLGLGAQLTVNGQNRSWDTSITGFLTGANVTLNEQVTFGNALCDWAGPTHGTVTEDNGLTPANGALPYADTLGAGSNHYTITNAVTCRSDLTLVKQVLNGPALASAWTLSATPVDGGIAFASGNTGVSHPVTASSAYQLDENDADPRYNQVGDWTCTEFGSVSTVNSEQQVSVAPGRSATCTVQNATGELVLRKVVENQNGGSLTAGDFDLFAMPQGGGTTLEAAGSNAGVTFYVDPDTTFFLSEDADASFNLPVGQLPPGYAQVSIVCNGDATTSVQVPANGSRTCTFTNRDVPANLTLLKAVDPGTSGATAADTAWTLRAVGPTTIEGTEGDLAITDAPVPTGTYTLSEFGGPAGWTGSAWNCGQSHPVVNSQVTVALGDQVTCEVTNTAVKPQLTLLKTVDHGTTGDTTPDTAWTLTATGPDTISGTEGQIVITDALVQIGEYTLTESGPAGFTASTWDCGQGHPVTAGKVTIALGDDVTCEITNTAVPGKLTLLKTVDPGTSGATAADTDWTLQAAGPVTISGTEGQPVITNAQVPNGVYTLSESGGPSGWTGSTWDCGSNHPVVAGMISIGLADDITCTVTNTAVKPLLTLEKTVEHGTTGDTTPDTAWTLKADGPDTIQGTEGQPVITDAPVQIGEYDLSEFGGPAGFTASTWDCGRGHPVTAGKVTLALGDDVTCTITNTAIKPQLTLLKTVNHGNTGDTTPDTAWTLTATGPDTISGTEGQPVISDALVQIGEYTLTESGGPAGFTASTWDCGQGHPVTDGKVTIALGDDVTCEITNSAQSGSLTLRKTVDPGTSGATAADTDWTLKADGPTTIEGTEGQPVITNAEVANGTYTLSEFGGPAGWTGSTWDCGQGHPVTDSQVTIGLAQDVTCTITNTAVKPQLTLIKHVDPGSTGDQTGPDAFTLSATPQAIAGQDTVTGPGPEVNADVKVGTYALDESGPSTYAEGTWTCTDDEDNPVPVSASDQFTIGLGEHITCEITNTAIPSSWRVTKSSVPVSGSTVQPGDQIQYTITVTRVGDGVDVLDIDVVDTLTGIDLSWVSNIVASNGIATPGDGVINWHIDALSDTVTLTYTVNVGQVFGATLRNVVTPGPTPCVDPVDDTPNIIDCDSTTHFTPHFTLDKDVSFNDGDGDGLAEPGQTLTYTLTMRNDTENALVEDAVVTDDVSDVLDNGSIVETPAQLAAKGLVLNGNTLTWTVSSLAPGATIEVTYQVLIAASQWGVTLRNVATPEPGGPGECVDVGECETTTETPDVTTLVVEKRNLETQVVLAGATFQLWLDNNNPGSDPETGDCTFATPPVVGAEDDLIDTEVTNAEGQAFFAELQKGCYLLVESDAPPGYDLPSPNVWGIAINDGNFVADGLMAPIVVDNFAQGQLAILAKRQFELIDGEWVESDGKVNFGDVVKYEIEIDADGPKLFHDVTVTDWVPGYNPDDVRTTLAGTLVGDPRCVTDFSPECTVTVGDDNLITWDLGTFTDAGGVVTFVTRFAQLPDNIDPTEDYTACMWNQAYLDWDELSLNAGLVHQTRASNEVEVCATQVGEPIVPPPPPPPPTHPPLPNTGVQAYLTQLAVLGGLVLALGLVLLRRSRRKEAA